MSKVPLYAVTKTIVQCDPMFRHVVHRSVVQADDGEYLQLGFDVPRPTFERIVDRLLPVIRRVTMQSGHHQGGDYDCLKDRTYFTHYLAMTPEMKQVFDELWAGERYEYIEKVSMLNKQRLEARQEASELERRIDAYRALPWYTRLWAAIRNREFQQEI